MKTCILSYFHNDALLPGVGSAIKQIDIWHHRHQSSLNMDQYLFSAGKIGIRRFSQNSYSVIFLYHASAFLFNFVKN